MLLQKFARFILKLIGWKITGGIPHEKKYVTLVAPHTSNIDFFIGKLANWAMGIKPKVLIKKEAFNFITSPFIKMWGGIPIDRSKGAEIIPQVVKLFNEREELILAITPEGTRKRNPNWKTGFYRIAIAANVPVSLAYIDFGKKELSMGKMFYPTGNMEEDIKKVKEYYKDKKGYHPEKFAVE